VTRIPQLERELVGAAGRLQSPRRVVRPAMRAAVAAVAVVGAVVVAVEVNENDRGDGGRQPTGTPPSQGAKVGVDLQAGVRLSLDGRVLTASLLSWAGSETRNRVSGAQIRATCGVAFAQVGPEGDPRNMREERTRLWPAGRDTLRFRFPGDISSARWCRIEDPVVGHVAFVKFGAAPAGTLSPTARIERNANRWARLFAASDPNACAGYMVQPACERMSCTRVGTGTIPDCTPPSAAFRSSFRGVRVEEVAIKGLHAGVSFSNGRTILLSGVEGSGQSGSWWIESFTGNAGRRLLEK
jgi:hypothetical protein